MRASAASENHTGEQGALGARSDRGVQAPPDREGPTQYRAQLGDDESLRPVERGSALLGHERPRARDVGYRGQGGGLPVYRMLGGPVRDGIRAYTWPGPYKSPEELGEAALYARETYGYNNFKIDPFTSYFTVTADEIRHCWSNAWPPFATRWGRRRGSRSMGTGASIRRPRSASPRRWSHSIRSSSRSPVCRTTTRALATVRA